MYEEQEQPPMTSDDKDWAFRHYQTVYSVFRPESQLSPTAMAALWLQVSKYNRQTLLRATQQLSDTWKGEYPPSPADVGALCRQIVERDKKRVCDEELAAHRAAGLLPEHGQNSFDERVAKRAQEMAADGLDPVKAICRAVEECIG